ncbi:MAG: hypothetical protein WAX77_13930 [Methylococcaceae bacterium]
MSDSSQCPHCCATIHWNSNTCPECNNTFPTPNQRELLNDDELQALQSRYQLAKQKAEQDNTITELEQLELTIKNDSKAIINIRIANLLSFLSSENNLLSNYNLQTESEIRLVAKIEEDRQRRIAEAVLFPSYAKEIRYAALSLDNKGLISYGACSIFLKDSSMLYRASILEENSFYFVEKNLGTIWNNGVPKGYRAVWTERHLLAVIKLADKLNGATISMTELLLKTNGNRAHDEFMEIHIYGALSFQSIEAIALPQAKNPREEMELSFIRDSANNKIECINL